MRYVLIMLCSLAAANLVWAKGDPNAGAQKSEVCSGCHGADGQGVEMLDPRPPRLAGQYADYLANALKNYKSGHRSNPVMQAFAANLSEQDIADLAAYYAQLDSPLADLSQY